MSAHQLYTSEVLAAAVSLANLPLTSDFAICGTARSASCGSRIKLGLIFDDVNRLAQIGVASHACAIGQASAAIFAKGAIGLTAQDLRDARDAMDAWLADKRGKPDWPGLDVIAAARDYPARHGAIMLAWNAACDAMAADAA